MAVIEGGIVVSGGVVNYGSPGARTFFTNGAPVAGTDYAGQIAVGDFCIDVDTGNLYEYTEPAAVPTFTRIDTV